jgi:hypothetical protein
MAEPDEEAAEEIEEAEDRMDKEESEARENEEREEHVDKLEEEAKEELDREGEEVKEEAANEKEGEDPETSAKHHKEMISQEEHTEKILREVFEEIDDEVREEIEEEKLLTNNIEELGRAAMEVLSDLSDIDESLNKRQTNDVSDEELKQIESLIPELGESIKQEERGLKELEELEKQVRNTEVQEERALELIEESVEEEEVEKDEIKYEGERAERQDDEQAEEYLEKEYEKENELEQEDEALASAITSEVNVELVKFAKDLRHDLKQTDGYLDEVEEKTEAILGQLDRELAKCQRESGGQKEKRIKKVRSDIEEFELSAEKELEKEKSFIEDEISETGQIVKEGEKISDFALESSGSFFKKAMYAVAILIGGAFFLMFL